MIQLRNHSWPLAGTSWMEARPGECRAGRLYGRMESACWEPPLLTFEVERHGETVLGSKRAALQHWTIDVDAETATLAEGRYRLVRPRQPKLNVDPLANEIASLVLQRQADPRLTWYPDGHVLVHIGLILPQGRLAKQTVEGRRRRFRQGLDTALLSKGWKKGHAHNTYEPPQG